MSIEFTENELKELILDSYELMSKIPSPEPTKYEIKSRSKLKSLPEALREFSDAQSSITHFIKSASYFLPRSDSKSKLTPFLDLLLQKVQKMQSLESDSERTREKIRYLVGYTNWSMDAVCNIFTTNPDDNMVRKRLHTMISAELGVLGDVDAVDKTVKLIMTWKADGSDRRG